MGKMTRKEWAAVFGVEYQTMVIAVRGLSHGRRIPGQLFDGEMVRSALVRYFNDRRMKHLEKANDLGTQIDTIRGIDLRGVVR